MDELSFNTNSLFEEIRYDPNSNDWIFSFSHSISVLVSSFWRLLDNGKISLVSLDHGHQFGMPNSVDMTELLSGSLTGKALTGMHVVKNTGDLRLSFTDNMEIEIFITSTGYESYQFGINGKTYIALGGGDIAIF